MTPTPSIIQGPKEPELWSLTLGQLVHIQADRYSSKDAIIVPWTKARLSYLDLSRRSEMVAQGLLAMGVHKGSHVAIFSSDDERFIELFFAVGRIGAILVILNKTYTVAECERALQHSDSSLLFVGNVVNRQSTAPLLRHLQGHPRHILERIIMTRWDPQVAEPFSTWDSLLQKGSSVTMGYLLEAESQVHCEDTVALLFTSGTTGAPKAAMLSHFNIINNGRSMGDRLELTPDDVVCCPPPLFHCFGLVAGMLAAVTHGSAIVFPHADFDAAATVDALVAERCTLLHGVPAMLTAVLHHVRQTKAPIRGLRTGIIGGSKVPPTLLVELKKEMGYRDIVIAYGMTETSAASFMTKVSDTTNQKLDTVGTIMPHVSAKIVDQHHHVLPHGKRGELCVSGYLLQQGYYRNPSKTREVMIRDAVGVLWMHTGDEAAIDEQGYCHITGRVKDIIIRGGENVYPCEIEELLLSHPAVEQASVIGIPDDHYGEAVAAFLQLRVGHVKPSSEEVRDWVRQDLSRHKSPSYIFWVGPGETIERFPVTGSGKIRKDILREIGIQIPRQERMINL
ncbi:acetyl-CoA synthetase-like protein [Aspergillus sclerotioniger CBS 115572]|uniref:Acetyl-CoA synthetase-like protein n=1 Tax=Aspergillus sclerotioniger CBS 115572 TaxID=1450535 RepID=A0A317X4I8_9EURO|nr:acetyl-CoA synthetase-like protein [Aspergillus sclerotioniger CBS 115572]PWY91868.1 acetyl-CoA synthetase-like protein [Aspergillus sclerotioniger CBS 115572]